MASFTYTKKERNFKKISAFLNVSENLLNQQDPNLITKMIDAADDDKMIEVHHYQLPFPNISASLIDAHATLGHQLHHNPVTWIVCFENNFIN
jgi:hypothetical protein